ncbi:hypothetical protein [Rhodothermus bifroesti]|jgi:predicted nuclease with TOPRIM domain|uniref:Uncharacterized protein n=1 Tax=Rhodothermus marinus TaxID=29549 RepID=A0A7V2F6B9_RHOMR|nr:hypothetical protein [Rhodothermus bifroesti]GBD00516.1 hypothetical protein HRbin18_00225 [bacterium HR18]
MPAVDPKDFWAHLQERLAWLQREVERLIVENERLREENRRLREEVTLYRLFQELQPQSKEELPELSAEMLRQAMEFLDRLPDEMGFSEFFDRAEQEGIESAVARDYLLTFLREELLRQQGGRLRKTHRAAFGKA